MCNEYFNDCFLNIPMKIFIHIKYYIKEYQMLKIIPDSDEIVFLIQAILGVFQSTCDE